MSCHTWVYKKMSAMPQTEIDKIYDEAIAWLKKEWNHSCDVDEVFKTIGGTIPKDELRKSVDKKKAQIEKFFKRADENKINAIGYIYGLQYNSKVVNDGDYYYQLCVDTPFRCRTYTNKTFNNKEELKKWIIENPSLNISYEWFGKERHDTEMELFIMIDKFFEKHGDDNLYFDFG